MSYCSICKKKIFEKGISFHRFPVDPILKRKWLQVICGNTWEPPARSVICSKHFENRCFEQAWKRVRLKKDSIPSLNLRNGDIRVQDIRNKNDTIHNEDYETTDQIMECSENPNSFSDHSFLENSMETSHLEVTQTQRSPGKIVEHDHNYGQTHTTLERKVDTIRKKLTSVRKQNSNLKRKMKRSTKKINHLKDVISVLKKRKSLPNDAYYTLSNVENFPIQLYNRMSSNKESGTTCRKKYPQELRCFALTVHFYSPQAYSYVRKSFNLALPHPRVLRSWYQNVDAEPGFTEEAFTSLKIKVDAASTDGKYIICGLMLDEMAIKQGTQRGRDGKMRGHVDLGIGAEPGDNNLEAKNILVFMVVPLNDNWKLPIAYFLIQSLNAEIKANLVKEALIKLQEVKVKICSLTLDGPADHMALLEMLGAKITCDETMQTAKFPHPVSTEPDVCVFLDPCHMLKNIRNCLEDYGVILDGENSRIEWRYIENLHKLQQSEGLRLGNKLKGRHINYKKQIMKVYLAAQTLSASVADSIEFCWESLKLPQFKGCEATVQFIRCIDKIFDFLNTRNPWAKNFKAPLTTYNESLLYSRMMTELKFLRGLKTVSDISIFQSRRKTGFIGFYTAVVSTFEIFHSFVVPNNIPRLLTYKMSQDHLELFFCAMRQRSGWCPNPTASQVVSAYKRLLVRHDIAVCSGNVKKMDETKILNVSSSEKRKQGRVDRYDVSVYDAMDNQRIRDKYGFTSCVTLQADMNEFLKFKWALTENFGEFVTECVGYIAGFVVKSIQDRIMCEDCLMACEEDSSQSDLSVDKTPSFVATASHGRLIKPSTSVKKICYITEKFFRRAYNSNFGKIPVEINFPAVLGNAVFSEILEKRYKLFEELESHSTDLFIVEDFIHHTYKLIKNIIERYIEVRMFCFTSDYSQMMQGAKSRHFLNRQIIWAHQ